MESVRQSIWISVFISIIFSIIIHRFFPYAKLKKLTCDQILELKQKLKLAVTFFSVIQALLYISIFFIFKKSNQEEFIRYFSILAFIVIISGTILYESLMYLRKALIEFKRNRQNHV